jgi:hypothetical protein
MPHYRCYFMGADGKIVDVEVTEQAHDGAAYAWSADQLELQPPLYRAVEVWDRERIVCRHDRPRAGPSSDRTAAPAL